MFILSYYGTNESTLVRSKLIEVGGKIPFDPNSIFHCMPVLLLLQILKRCSSIRLVVFLPESEYNATYAPQTYDIKEYHEAVEYIADAPYKAYGKSRSYDDKCHHQYIVQRHSLVAKELEHICLTIEISSYNG